MNANLPEEQSTVPELYHSAAKTSTMYQSEAALEEAFISTLVLQGYERAVIHTEKELISNLRTQLERLNNVRFNDSEWSAFFDTNIANKNESIEGKAFTVQEDYIKLLKRDDSSTRNIRLFDKANIYNNTVQVINQYQERGEAQNARYDVTVLVNGLPLVHIELKRRGVALEEAFNQIARYQERSFCAGSALFEYVQIFVISNGTDTKYYSNTTRGGAVKENSTAQGSRQRTSNSFKFTSYWADAMNNRICDIEDFSRTFMTKSTLLNVLFKYCVFTSDKMLLVMRPYQIAATEKILHRIRTSEKERKYSTTGGGGYIWHTTGSGKTLTSFKTAVLASAMDCVDCVLFVVDRKDLDYQTMKEYDNFKKGAANATVSTKDLASELSSKDSNIIITTIQKLFIFAKKYNKHEVFNKRVVMIFDECHRSQGSTRGMHALITSRFKHYHIFGFTGTPILPQTANITGKNITLTTEKVFGQRLHLYSIIDAIKDKNVLPFRVDYIRSVCKSNGTALPQADAERMMTSGKRISEVVRYILKHFEQKTRRDAQKYSFNRLVNIKDMATSLNQKARQSNAAVSEKRERVSIKGFNSILTVSSIEAAIKYYKEFKAQQAQRAEGERLRLAMIYSYCASAAGKDGGSAEDENGTFTDDENSENTTGLSSEAKRALDEAIADYNAMTHSNYSTSADEFQNYYKDLSLRMKNMEIDILIVVNMFLTGFDATALNTLWVDKNLKYHGLLQAYSRTNRILNSVKTYGNIVCFRDLESATDEAIALFGSKKAHDIALLKSFESYYNGYNDMPDVRAEGMAEARMAEVVHHAGYKEVVDTLLNEYPVNKEIKSEEAQHAFIDTYNQFLRLQNILSSFDEFAGNEILNDRQMQDYKSKYIDLYNDYTSEKRHNKNSKRGEESALPDVVFEMELIKQVEINVDYILALIKERKGDDDDAFIAEIKRLVRSTTSLRGKESLITAFAKIADRTGDVLSQWSNFVRSEGDAALQGIIAREHLKEDKTLALIKLSAKDGVLHTEGTQIADLLPPLSRFGTAGQEREQKKNHVQQVLQEYFSCYWM